MDLRLSACRTEVQGGRDLRTGGQQGLASKGAPLYNADWSLVMTAIVTCISETLTLDYAVSLLVPAYLSFS